MVGCEIGVGKRKYEEVQEEGSGPKVLKYKSPKVPGSKGPGVLGRLIFIIFLFSAGSKDLI